MRNRFSGWTTLMMLVVALFWVQGVPAAGQGPGGQVSPSIERLYGRLAGCSDEPLQFHQCAKTKAKDFSPPRTPDGKPDFRGFWGRAGVFGTDNIEEHTEGLGDPGGKSLVVDPADGKIPYQPWAAAKKQGYFTTYMDPGALCFLPGSPRQLYAPGVNQILQTPGSLIFLNDYTHAYRVIPTDGRPHIGPNIRLFMGNSRGRWEGNTLVVDVTNQNAKAWFDHMGNFYSDAVHVVERWTMIGADAIHYEALINDPKVYTRPWTMAFGLRRNPDPRYFMMENACHEGNQSRVPGAPLAGDLKPYFGTEPPN